MTLKRLGEELESAKNINKQMYMVNKKEYDQVIEL